MIADNKLALNSGWDESMLADELRALRDADFNIDVVGFDTSELERYLEAGWCTVQFNAFLQKKTTTQKLKGGNTDAFYATEGTMPKSEMQVRMHPDVSRLVWRFNRWHHYVDYTPFKKTKLIRKSGVELADHADNYWMVLKKIK